MSEPKADLVAFGKEHVASVMADLAPDDDPMPMLLHANTDHELTVVAMEMPDEDGKDKVATVMVSSMVLGRAVEALFSSSTWTVEMPEGEEVDPERPRVMPSEDPNRTEKLILLYGKPDNQVLHWANIIRTEGEAPTLGEWEAIGTGDVLGGRFGEAIQAGLTMAAKLPPEMIEILETAKEHGKEEMLLRAMTRALWKLNGKTPEEVAEMVTDYKDGG